MIVVLVLLWLCRVVGSSSNVGVSVVGSVCSGFSKNCKCCVGKSGHFVWNGARCCWDIRKKTMISVVFELVFELSILAICDVVDVFGSVVEPGLDRNWVEWFWNG